MKTRRIAVLGAAAALSTGGVMAAPAALAEVSPHCPQAGFCLFPGADFTGTMVGVPAGTGCRQVSTLGITEARSAARGYGDASALQLYADSGCTTSAGSVLFEIPDTVTVAYRLVPLPG
jgi:hypothetical protein